jgi:hypothetical protein
MADRTTSATALCSTAPRWLPTASFIERSRTMSISWIKNRERFDEFCRLLFSNERLPAVVITIAERADRPEVNVDGHGVGQETPILAAAFGRNRTRLGWYTRRRYLMGAVSDGRSLSPAVLRRV